MEITTKADTLVSGNYFNKNGSGDKKLSGTRKSDTLRLKETDMNGSIVAEWFLVSKGDSLFGNWKKTGAKNGLPVRAYKTNPSFKASCKIPKADSLSIKSGQSLAAEMASRKQNSSTINPYEITFARYGVLGTKYTYPKKDGENTWDVSQYYVFELNSKKQLELLKEIESSKLDAFVSLLNEKATANLQAFKSNSGMSEEEWIQEFGDAAQYKAAFEKTNLIKEDLANFGLDEDGIHIMKPGYFGLRPSMKSLDLDLDILI
ncbi:MAG: hypothetical protein ACKO9S_01450, partial [Bacteroidota bacterium]